MADIPFEDQLKWLSGLTNIPSNAARGMGGFVNTARDTVANAIGKGAEVADIAATGGLLSPLVQLYAQEGIGETENRNNLTNEFIRNLALNATGAGVGRGLQALAAMRAAKLLNRATDIGVHHSPIGTITDMINPSVANRGVTAWDQVPGYSYFWNTADPELAAREVSGQLDWMLERVIPDDNWQRSAYITQALRRLIEEDPNVPGYIARRVLGGQKVVDRLVAPGDFVTSKINQEELVAKILDAVRKNEASNKALENAASRAVGAGAAATPAALAAQRTYLTRNELQRR